MSSSSRPPTSPKDGLEEERAIDDLVVSGQVLAEINAALREVGDFGEVHLVIRSGKLRFLRIVQSLSLFSSDHIDN